MAAPPDPAAPDGDAPAAPRPAASLVLLRAGTAAAPEVLMGRRPETARFMPGVFVFPGGAVEPGDAAAAAGALAPGRVPPQLLRAADAETAAALVWTALRETWEETGVIVGGRATRETARGHEPPDALAAAGLAAGVAPGAARLAYVARAVTPPTSPIRFDTHFFLADAAAASGAARASGELPEVRWLSAEAALADPDLREVSKFALRAALALYRGEADPAHADRRIPCMTHEDGRRIVRET